MTALVLVDSNVLPDVLLDPVWGKRSGAALSRVALPREAAFLAGKRSSRSSRRKLSAVLGPGDRVPDVPVWAALGEDPRLLPEVLGPGLSLLCVYVFDWSPT